MIEEANPLIVARDAIVGLKKRQIEREMEDNQQQLKAASSRGENINQYLERHEQLREEKKKLESGKIILEEDDR